jgi:hypothetical protein
MRNRQSDLVESGLPCPMPGCGSSDAYATYSDGHGYCFSCGGYKKSSPERKIVLDTGDEDVYNRRKSYVSCTRRSKTTRLAYEELNKIYKDILKH